MIIYGAGLSGLLAACTFQNATILDAAPFARVAHKALLRFRSSAVGDSVGIEFKKVMVRKGIWLNDRFVEPNICLANIYSQKTIGLYADRSIWNIEPSERYIAPDDFIEQLLDRCASRIAWGVKASADNLAQHAQHGPVLSTIPMSTMATLIKPEQPPCFNYAPITVKRFRLPRTDLYQTIYFPSPHTTLYRASITGDLMIAEYVRTEDNFNFWHAFGMEDGFGKPIDVSQQSFGKIAVIDDKWRKRYIFELSHRHNIFSLGRFGIWKNILLDDVVKDLSVIKRLLASNPYERYREST